MHLIFIWVNLAWTVDAGMQHLCPHHVSSELQHAFNMRSPFKPGGYKEMSSIFADQERPRILAMRGMGGGGGLRVL
jgi:hypothetical protein